MNLACPRLWMPVAPARIRGAKRFLAPADAGALDGRIKSCHDTEDAGLTRDLTWWHRRN